MPEELSTQPEENLVPKVCTIVILPTGTVHIHGNLTLDELARISFDIALRRSQQEVSSEVLP